MADVAFIPGCGGTSEAACRGWSWRAPQQNVLSFSSAPRGKPILPTAPHRQGGLGAGPATKELEAKLNKRKLNVVPQRGWNHFWGSSERKGSKLHPTLEIAVPRQIPRRTAGQSQTRPLSVRWQDREIFHVVPKLAQMEAFWVGPLQSVNSSGWGQGSRRSPISASCLTEAQATQSTMASSFLII